VNDMDGVAVSAECSREMCGADKHPSAWLQAIESRLNCES